MGFQHVESGPLVRSSYHAADAVENMRLRPVNRAAKAPVLICSLLEAFIDFSTPLHCLPLILPALILPMAADEGMWLYNQFPKDAVQEKYNFAVTPEFLDNLRLAAARIPGGSASFVSPTGLLLTNQHLVSGCLAKASTAATITVRKVFTPPPRRRS